MGSFLTGATGTGNHFAAASAPIEKDQDFSGELGTSLGQYNSTFNNQNSLAHQLQSQAMGQGPNPAQIQLQQATNRNIQQNAGFLSSQKGLSPALAARLAAQNQAQVGQQAAGQGALMGAQQQLGAQGQLANVYGNQSQGALGAYQTQQNALSKFNDASVSNTSQMNTANASVAAQNAKTSGGLLGGVMGALGPVANLALTAGEAYMTGGASLAAPALAGGAGDAMGGGGGLGDMAGAATMLAAHGGMVPVQMKSQGGSIDKLRSVHKPKSDVGDYLNGGGCEALKRLNSGGDPAGTVPGQAQVAGDSLKNDKVPAMLSPREIVIPRSITTHPNAPALAAEFVRRELEKHGQESKKKFADGGVVDSVKGWFGDNTQSQATTEGNQKNAQMADPRSIPPAYPTQSKGGKFAHYADGGNVLPQSLDANAPETQLAPVDTSFDPGQALTPTPGQDYGQIYQKQYEQQRQMNPGEPDEWSRNHALMIAEQSKKADAMAQNFNNQRQVSSMQSAHDSAIAENTRRQSLGLSPVPVPEAPAQVALQQPQSQQNPALSQIPDMNQPNPMVGMTDSMMHGYGNAFAKQEAGINQQAQVQGQLGEQNANIAHNEAAGQFQLMQDYQTKLAQYNDQYDKAMQDYSEGHINPNHYAESLGSVGKVSTAIGLILGGIGGGLLGTENPALKFMNQQIDRDIKAQETDLGKKQNLLTANYHRLGNLRDATDMTRAMMLGFQASQFKEAAAKAQGPMAKAIALQHSGEIEQRRQDILGPIAMRQAMMSGQGGQMDPAMAINFMAPEGQKVELMKQLQTAQNMSKQKDNLLNAFDQVVKLNTLPNRLMHPIQSSQQIEALTEPLLAQLIKDSEGRITPQDTQMMQGLFSKLTSDKGTTALKRNQLNKFVSEKMNFPALKMYGFDPSQQGRFNALGVDRLPPMAPPKR